MDVITAEGARATMTIFAISNDNYITVLDSVEDAKSNPETEHFSSLKELAKLAAQWPASRLVEVWNNLPGATPVKKFTDRKTAIARIWKVIQELEAVKPPQAPPAECAAPAEPEAKDVAAERGAVAPVSTDPSEKATQAKRVRRSALKPQGSREGSKTVVVLELLKQAGGVTLTELMAASGWQAHSVRGFLSGTVRKKMGLALVSAKREDGTRGYSLPA